MKAVLLFAAVIFSTVSSYAQDRCGLSLRSPQETEARAEKTFQSLKVLLGGTPVNAGIAVDRILMEVQLRLDSSQTPRGADSLSPVKNYDQVDAQLGALKRLEDSLAKKSGGFLQRFKKSSLREEVEKRLTEVTAGRETLAELTISISQNIERLRAQQLDVEAWVSKVNDEIDYLQGLIDKVAAEAGMSPQLSKNFEEEIFPRLLQEANGLMSQQLIVAKSFSINLANRVTAEQMALENIKSLQALASEVSIARAKAFLELEFNAAKDQEKQEQKDAESCYQKSFCAGETVFYWYNSVGDAYWRPVEDHFGKVVSIYEDGRRISFLPKNNKTDSPYREYLARAQKGLVSKGIAVGDIVVDNRSFYYKIVGIFLDGSYLGAAVEKSTFFWSEKTGTSESGKSTRLFQKLNRSDFAKVK